MSMAIIEVATELSDRSLEREILAQYELDLGCELNHEDVFDTDGQIHDYLPSVGIKVGYDMGWQKRIG